MKFLTADTHLGHENLIVNMGRLGFDDIKQHDDHVIDRINSKVGRNDELVIAGDFSWRAAKYRPRIRCRHIVFIRGNHDRFMDCTRTFGKMWDYKEIRLGPDKVKCFVCHYPTVFWPASHHGSFHAYGHCHKQREATLDLWMPQRRSLDVGVDNAKEILGDFEPFSEHEFLGYLSNRSGHDSIEFYNETRAKLLE